MRRSRELALFSMSALDVLAMSTGVFVLLLVMMMPYYRNVHDARAEAERARSAAVGLRAEAAATAARAAEMRAQTEALEAERAQAAAEAATLRRRAAADLRAGEAALRAAAVPAARRAPEPAPKPAPPAETVNPVVERLDLVFVVDRTASMEPALRDLAGNIRGVAAILTRLVPSVRIGVVAYSDRDVEAASVRVLPLTPTADGIDRVAAFIDGLQASTVGSRTAEEDVFLGLQAAMSLGFRADARQTLVLIGDAAAHPAEQAAALQMIRLFVAASSERAVSALFVATPSSLGRGRVDRAFFQAVAAAGRGAFTEHAGVMIESVLASALLDAGPALSR